MLGLEHFIDIEFHESLSPRIGTRRVAIPIDRSPAGQLKRAPRFEIDKEQSSMWIQVNVSQGVEQAITVVVGNNEPPVSFDMQKTRIAAARGSVHPSTRVCTRDKEGIGACDPLLLRL